jgi:hypothetical protein
MASKHDQQPHGRDHCNEQHPGCHDPGNAVKSQRTTGEAFEVKDQGHQNLDEGQRGDRLVDTAQTRQRHGQEQAREQAQQGADGDSDRGVEPVRDGHDGCGICAQRSKARRRDRKGASAKNDRLAESVTGADEDQIQQRQVRSDKVQHVQ